MIYYNIFDFNAFMRADIKHNKVRLDIKTITNPSSQTASEGKRAGIVAL